MGLGSGPTEGNFMKAVFIKGSCHNGETGVYKGGSLLPVLLPRHVTGSRRASPDTATVLFHVQNYELNKMFVCNFFQSVVFSQCHGKELRTVGLTLHMPEMVQVSEGC